MNKQCRTPLRILLCLLGAVYASFVVGCDDEPPPPETVVRGSVTYHDAPVTGGIVLFYVKDGDEMRKYAGEIYDDGTYELTYIVPGEAFIAIDTTIKKGLPTFVSLPDKFINPRQSGLSYTVTEGPQTYDIELD